MAGLSPGQPAYAASRTNPVIRHRPVVGPAAW
jgi:hypothetical protein